MAYEWEGQGLELKLSQLAIVLDRVVPRIPQPREDLEQYTTPGDLAARLVWVLLAEYGDLRGVTAADLGSGTGMLSLALALAGARLVVGVEADSRLVPLALRAAEELGVESRVAFIVSRITRSTGPLSGGFNVIVMNPPFGVWRRGADTMFLLYAFSLEPEMVVAILKFGNLGYFKRLSREWGYRARSLLRYPFPIPAQMRRHRSRIRRVLVEVVMFEREN